MAEYKFKPSQMWLNLLPFSLYLSAFFSCDFAFSAPLVVVGDQDAPPVTYLENGEPTGFDIDIAKALGEVLGREIQIKLMPWEIAQERVLAGQADLLTSMSMSAERENQWDFATATLNRSFALFVRSNNMIIRGIHDLSGRTIGVMNGSLPKEILEGRFNANLNLITNYADGMNRLIKGELDAVAADEWVGGFTLQKERINGVTMAGDPLVTMQAAFAVRKGNHALREEINRGLEILRSRGTIETIRHKWEPQQILFFSKEQIHRLVFNAVGGFGLFVVLALSAWVYSLLGEIKKRRKSELEQSKSEALYKELSRRVVAVQEEERRRIAYELHDEIGQQLTGIKFKLFEARVAPQDTIGPQVQGCIDLVSDAIGSVRNLSFDLRPALLDALGLEAALSGYLERQAKHLDLEPNLESNIGNLKMDTKVETVCFRVVQEAVTNIVRYAETKLFFVKIWFEHGQLELQIRDGGIGFDVDKILPDANGGKSFGLLGMRERVISVGGRFGIASSVGEGTLISAIFERVVLRS